ncbi:Hypothetical predicted protein [Cloeon dipterum]|uniref:PARP catalytic domain-containing protein n=1 Tax=Cloeon dipterum TaxID=197152 RepID=A0A8S1D3W9_9INSE|nr:Hypothetical predicted protein [Cloeon dipterum]
MASSLASSSASTAGAAADNQKYGWYDGFRLTEVPQNGARFAYVKCKVADSFHIKKVFKIDNNKTWAGYKQVRERIFRECGKQWVCEKRLFLCTPDAKTVAETGFTAAMGSGIVFSVLPNQCAGFSRQGGAGSDAYALLCRVAVGHQGRHSQDSGTQVRVMNDQQAYPRYLIIY